MQDKKRIFTIAASHLDTSWLWTLETTIDEYIPNTLYRNFKLFDRYPEYTFGFEGSYRYELIEEYYPDAFEKLKEYVKKGRWHPVGSSYENGDVNMPSPEALFRNILYGNTYFNEKFGKTANDIFLPDCFGFGYALPSIAAHAGLIGFSTGKLAWGSAYGQPFDIGKWYGVDGRYIYANIKPSSYARTIKDPRKDKAVYPKLKDNEKYDLPLTATFYGTGDRGGAPAESSVKAVCDSIRENAKKQVDVLSVASTELFDAIDDLPENIKQKMPVWDNELPLTNHGVGSYTSRTVGTRWNNNCERLASSTEKAAAAAAYLTDYAYPEDMLNTAWKRCIAHQFHDDLTGTSFMECYLRNWNDYMLSQKQFVNEYEGAAAAISSGLDTSFVKGTAIVVNNSLQYERTETVLAEVNLPSSTKYIYVTDKDGKEVPSQIKKTDIKGLFSVAFAATVPPFGFSVFDLRVAAKPKVVETPLKVAGNTLENDYVRVMLNSKGDICEIYDKRLNKNVLKKPIRLAVFDYKGDKTWPAWELTYKELMKEPREYAANAKLELIEFGPARASYKVTKSAGMSKFTQIISLDSHSPTLSVYNEVDWRSTSSLLKVEFPLAADNEKATYDIGLGTIKRGNNTESLYEVPAQKWADITDYSNEFGVSVFSDSRVGWDKPNNNTLRLTAVHTPYYPYRWECSQHLMDLGLNRFSFAVFPHKGDVSNKVQSAAECFDSPLTAFVTTAHKGALGSEYSFGNISDNSVIIRAIKKAHYGDSLVVRVNEGEGKAKKRVCLTLGNGIDVAKELDGCENEIGKAVVSKGSLVFDIEPFAVKTFELTLKDTKKIKNKVTTPIELPYNITAITSNENRHKGELMGKASIPSELIPEKILCGGVEFTIKKDGRSATSCSCQEIIPPKGSKKLYLLGFSENGDKDINIKVGDTVHKLKAADCFERIGNWDMIGLNQTGYIKKDKFVWDATHIHKNGKDITAKQLYTFMLEVPALSDTPVVLPANESVIILAASVSSDNNDFSCATQLYDKLEKRPFDYKLTKREILLSKPASLEKSIQKLVDREKNISAKIFTINGTIQVADAFSEIRKILSF
ncbi:MAG TPA: glycoside hydrolase family 38 C-terminal domain-containing protein [Oscillospiraceae bacterium]|nr:glycoside hydrolase family 38 C-terminal domain-containing protein [Oscillospiraceae bacterium]